LIYKIYQEYPNHQLIIDYDIEEMKNNKEIFDLVVSDIMDQIKIKHKYNVESDFDWVYCFNVLDNNFNSNITLIK
jgi:hypothetical protein